MSHVSSRIITLGVVAMFAAAIAGCSTAPSSAAPAGSEPGTSAPDAWLRATTSQALAPANVFAIGPTAVATLDGTYVTPGPVDAIYPGPLVAPLVGRPIPDGGRDAILAEARRLGLIGPKTDFRSVTSLPGGVTGRIELNVDGRPTSLTGEPEAQIICIIAPCDALPGTPEAFGQFWRELAEPETLPGVDLGPASPFVPEAYALLVGPAPAPDAALGASVADWPLDTPLATFGGPVANGTLRCGIVDGADADVLRPALDAANQLTQWVQDPSTSAAFGLTVRPIIAGENPCAETFGGG
jgi:hypothetical protein